MVWNSLDACKLGPGNFGCENMFRDNYNEKRGERNEGEKLLREMGVDDENLEGFRGDV